EHRSPSSCSTTERSGRSGGAGSADCRGWPCPNPSSDPGPNEFVEARTVEMDSGALDRGRTNRNNHAEASRVGCVTERTRSRPLERCPRRVVVELDEIERMGATAAQFRAVGERVQRLRDALPPTFRAHEALVGIAEAAIEANQ